MIKFLIAITLLVGITSCSVAQPGYYRTSDKKAKKYMAAADECMKVSATKMFPDVDCAIENINNAIERDPQFADAYVKVSELYEMKKDNKKAIEANLKALSIDPNYSSTGSLYYYTARLEMKEGMYEACKKHSQTYIDFRGNNPDFAEECQGFIVNCNFAIQAMKSPVPFEPKNLGPGVNTIHPEYFPALTGDDKNLLFTRTIPDSRVSKQMGGKQEDFYVSEFVNGQWQDAFGVSPKINTVANEGAPTISTDGRVLIFTACEFMQEGYYGDNREGKGSCDLFYSFKTGGNWSVPGNFGAPLNTFHWETQPSFSSDGRTLYFVRGIRKRGERRTGKDQDIYFSEYDEKAGWSKPQKLGPTVNTAGREESVHIHPDGQTLYFSSDGHPGMGGLDIFMSRKQPDGSWGQAINLGYPINTHGNENSLLVSSSGDIAYFASDREGGFGDLDIYGFELYEGAKPIFTSYAKGVVFDAVTNQKLEAGFVLIDHETKDTIVKSSSDMKTGEFLLSIPANKDYALFAQKPGYHNFSKKFTLKQGTNKDPFVLDVPMIPVGGDNGIIALENVFFDTDKDILKPESKLELDNLVKFLDKYQKIKIQLRGHTDSEGDDAHNLDLSERRAKSVVNYLVEHGIDKARLTSKGFGETDPIADNNTPEGRAKNRRTEYKITSAN